MAESSEDAQHGLPVAVAVPVGPHIDSIQQRPPPVLASSEQSPKRSFLEEDQILALKDQGFTSGLVDALSYTTTEYPLRIWVIDNSGSMNGGDGQRIVVNARSRKTDICECSRWSELQECVQYHAQLASLIRAPTKFRLLNHPGTSIGPQYFGVADTEGDNIICRKEVEAAQRIIRSARPKGKSPLIQHIVDIQRSVEGMAPQLNNQNQRVAVIIATDGLPTDDLGFQGGNASDRFVSALKTLEGLPVWIVIRLCTDEKSVVAFYQSLDDQLELSIDVLDDFMGEATEVFRHNNWLNYALPLHRCREIGFHNRVFDLIDEHPLTKDQLRDFCVFLFGSSKLDGVPNPSIDWIGFKKAIHELSKEESKQWNPAKKRFTPWIDMKALDRRYGNGKFEACSIA